MANDQGISARGCSNQALNIDVSSNLTKKQQYTIEQIQLARSGKSVNRYFSPNSTDLLAKIPISIGTTGRALSVNFTPPSPEITKRIYFGPVKLIKFNIIYALKDTFVKSMFKKPQIINFFSDYYLFKILLKNRAEGVNKKEGSKKGDKSA